MTTETTIDLRLFMSTQQLNAIAAGCCSEERQYFIGKIAEYANRIATMPATYEQESKGDQAIVYLHYFKGGCDWYITEKDVEPLQHQAFGLANLGYGGELGYISIIELISHNVELDLHWTPKPLAAIK